MKNKTSTSNNSNIKYVWKEKNKQEEEEEESANLKNVTVGKLNLSVISLYLLGMCRCCKRFQFIFYVVNVAQTFS